MNASGGIYWRSAPDWNTPVQTIGFGFYPDTVIAVHCYQAGAGNVPGSADYMWEYATDVGGSGFGTGWINEHFINDGQPINQPSPGVPPCGGSAESPAPPPQAGAVPSPVGPSPPASIYFSPFGRGAYEVGEGVTNLSVGTWGSQCVLPRLAYTSAMGALASGQSIATLAGWSYGRVGVISFLANASEQQLKGISYVLLIDPGTFDELGCDRFLHAGGVIGSWLTVNRGAHLVVISGSLSQKSDSKGIQESYFNTIRQRFPGVSGRVLVCNYSAGHTDSFLASKYWIQHRIGSARSACPQLSSSGSKWNASAGWHPIN